MFVECVVALVCVNCGLEYMPLILLSSFWRYREWFRSVFKVIRVVFLRPEALEMENSYASGFESSST